MRLERRREGNGVERGAGREGEGRGKNIGESKEETGKGGGEKKREKWSKGVMDKRGDRHKYEEGEEWRGKEESEI